MRIRTACSVIALAAVSLLAAVGCNSPRRTAHVVDPDLNEAALSPPQEALNGTAKMDEIKAWMMREFLYMANDSAGGVTFEVREQDLDQDVPVNALWDYGNMAH